MKIRFEKRLTPTGRMQIGVGIGSVLLAFLSERSF